MSTLTLSTVTAAAGEVSLSCKAPGSWRFRLDALPGDVESVHITLDSPEEAFPPPFEVYFTKPQGDIRHIWHPFSEHGFLPPSWHWQGRLRTSIASGMPLHALVGQDGGNRLTVACSEASRVLDTTPGLLEKSCDVLVRIGFFNAPEAPIRHYEAELRLDARRLPFPETVRQAADWLSSRPGYAPCAAPPAAFAPLYSTWYGFHQNVHASDIEAECAQAAAMGMKVVILDDGWQTDDASGSYAYCGDWEVSRTRFPDGMASHVARVHELGMKYMVWFSVPFMGYKSRNYARFRGKFLADAPNMSTAVLDPRFREVREFLAATYERALREWDVDGFKLDFIDRFRFDGDDPAAAEDFAGRDIRSLPDAVDRLLADILARLRAVKPDVLVEFRQSYIGPAIRKYGNMLRAADCPGDILANRARIANLRLTSGGTAVHADMLEWHPAATPQAAAMQILAALFGVVQYSMVLRDLPPSHLAMVRHWIAFTQEHREALLHGTFRPQGAAEGYTVLEGESATEAVAAVYVDNAVCEIAAPKACVLVVNATSRDALFLSLPAAPARVEAFDTFGAAVPAPTLVAGLQTAAVPSAGYLKLAF